MPGQWEEISGSAPGAGAPVSAGGASGAGRGSDENLPAVAAAAGPARSGTAPAYSGLGPISLTALTPEAVRAAAGATRAPATGEIVDGGGLDARLDKAVPTEAPVAFLLAGDGLTPGRVHPLSRNTTLVGRSEQADLRVNQPAVSNQHARIVNTPAGFEIEDLGSVNGTFVNGARVERSRLKRGDRLLLGNVEFTFLQEKSADATVALLPSRVDSFTANGARAAALAVRREGSREMDIDGGGPRRALASPRRRELEPDDEPGLSAAELLHRGAAAYDRARPHLPLLGRAAVLGLAGGLVTGLLLPPPNAAVGEIKLHVARKINPVDSPGHGQDDKNPQFFVDVERLFVMPALVRSTLEKLPAAGQGQVQVDDRRVAAVQSRLAITPVGESLFRASYQQPRFSVGAVPQPPPVEFLQAHIQNYVQTDIDRSLQALENERKFLDEKTSAAHAELTRLNQELADFRRQNVDDLPETSDQANSSRYYLETRRSELAATIARLNGELAYDQAQLASDGPLAESKFQASQSHRNSLAELKRKLSESYAKGWGDRHSEVISFKNEIARLEGIIQQEMTAATSDVDRAADPTVSGVRARASGARSQLRAAQVELREVEANLERIKRAVTTMPAIAARLDDLKRQYDAGKRLHDQLADQAQRAKLQVEVERLGARSRFDVVAPVYLQQPSRVKTLVTRGLIGVVLALLIALAVVLYREARRILAQPPPAAGSPPLPARVRG